MDIGDAGQFIDDFRTSLPSAELLNCADAAALLIESFDSCGIASFGVTDSCASFSVTQKSCATGYYR